MKFVLIVNLRNEHSTSVIIFNKNTIYESYVTSDMNDLKYDLKPCSFINKITLIILIFKLTQILSFIDTKDIQYAILYKSIHYVSVYCYQFLQLKSQPKCVKPINLNQILKDLK